MLVLSRMKSESVVVTGSQPGSADIRIVVVSIGKGQVKLGIEAPEGVPVYRMEVWQRIQAERDIVSSA